MTEPIDKYFINENLVKHYKEGLVGIEFRDMYDRTFTVQESSTATEPAFWIGMQAPNKALINIEQAKQVIAALQELINKNSPESECETCKGAGGWYHDYEQCSQCKGTGEKQ